MAEFRRVLVDSLVRLVEVIEDRFTWIDGRVFDVNDVVHLPPTEASKVVCVHLNYQSRLDELNWEELKAPTYFWKSPSSLNGHKGNVIRPKGCKFLNYEGEIVLVVGRTARSILYEDAASYVMGYTVGNDMALHDFRDTDMNSMVRVKGSDTLGPVGPGVKTDWDFRHKRIRTLVDGKVVQDSTTDDLIWDPLFLFADLARSITFLPGDLIFTGTPTNSRPVEPGSTVVVEVEGLGRLENQIVESQTGIAKFGAQPGSSDAILSVAYGNDHRKSA